MQEFCMVGDYTEDLEKPHNCQNWMQALAQGWGFAQGWALARDNMGELTLVVWYGWKKHSKVDTQLKI